DRADVLVFVEHLLPARAAVAGAVDTAIRMRTVDMPERGDVDDAGVARVDDDAADLARGFGPEGPPCPSRVRRLVDAVAVGDRVAHVGLPGADVDDGGVRRRHGD